MDSLNSLNPRQRGTLVEALGSAVWHGGAALGGVPALLKRLLQDAAWRDFETATHQHVTHDRFEAFVTTPPGRGLGTDLALIRRIVRDDPEALDLLDQTLQNPAYIHVGYGRDVDNVNITARPEGNTSEAALRRLRKDRPDLHARVLAGELSPHAAMVTAGYRRRTMTLPVDDVARLADSLKRHLTSEQLAALRAAL